MFEKMFLKYFFFLSLKNIFEKNALELGAIGKMIMKFEKKRRKKSIILKMLNDFQKSLTAESQVTWILIARCWRTRPGSPH